MLKLALTAAAIAAAALSASCSSRGAHGIDYPYCAVAGGDKGYESCSYFTLQQCLAATSGVGGHCMENPRYSPARSEDVPAGRPYR